MRPLCGQACKDQGGKVRTTGGVEGQRGAAPPPCMGRFGGYWDGHLTGLGWVMRVTRRKGLGRGDGELMLYERGLGRLIMFRMEEAGYLMRLQ
jgi:hypothetical protein